MTVHAWLPIERTVDPPPGTAWFAADIEFCLAPTVQSDVPISVIRDEFGAELADGTVIDADDGEPSAPEEAFNDTSATIAAEECVRGLVPFAMPEQTEVASVGLFSPLGERRWGVTDP